MLAGLFGLTLVLGSGLASHAMSTFVSISMEPQWPGTNDPGNVVLYTVTVTRAGQGDLEVALSSQGLPDGAIGTFSLNPVRFTGQVPAALTSTLTITLTNPVPTDPIPFTVTGRETDTVLTVTNDAGKTFDASFAANPASRPILALDLLGKRNMKLRGKGATAKTYRVEVTSSLGNPSWGPVGLTHSDVNGRFTYMDSDAKAPDSLFYRTSGPVDHNP
jgi:hypothetical protein